MADFTTDLPYADDQPMRARFKIMVSRTNVGRSLTFRRTSNSEQ